MTNNDDSAGKGPGHAPPTVLEKPTERATSDLTLPPGLVGELAAYFYSTALIQIPEIALSTAIGLMAGVAGRCYNISDTGLNLYLLVIAGTGTGKEGARKGINNLLAAVSEKIKGVELFDGPGHFASGQGLLRELQTRQCFVSLLGEFGLTLQQMCDPRGNNAVNLMLRKVLCDLYSQSGRRDVLRPSVYSDHTKNTLPVQAPCVSILADATEETFFRGIDASHIAEGLIPRFTVIQYTGLVPELNEAHGAPPDEGLTSRFAELAERCLKAGGQVPKCVEIQRDPDAEHCLKEFHREARDHINQAGSDVGAQLWNRAHLKALKLSGLIAVGMTAGYGADPDHPVVTRDIAEWAVLFIRREVRGMVAHFHKGDFGSGDAKMQAEIRRIVDEFYQADPVSLAVDYHVHVPLAKARIIPLDYLSRRTTNLSAFKHDRRGATVALNVNLKQMVDGGELTEMGPTTPLLLAEGPATLRQLGYKGKRAFARLPSSSFAPPRGTFWPVGDDFPGTPGWWRMSLREPGAPPFTPGK